MQPELERLNHAWLDAWLAKDVAAIDACGGTGAEGGSSLGSTVHRLNIENVMERS